MKKLLVIGAGFLQDAVILKANSMGYETLAVDANPNAVGFSHACKYKVIDIVNSEACLEWAREQSVDGVLTAATDYGVLTASYIAEQMGLKGPSYESVALIKNKYKVRKRLFEHKVDDTQQCYEADESTDVYELCKRLEFPVMIKPCDGSGSRGANRVDKPEDVETACREAINASRSKKAVIESFVSGKEYGAECLVIDGKVNVLAIMRKWMTEPPYYAELGHAIPTDLPTNVENRAKECVAKAVEAIGINCGSVNIDMIITDEGKIHIIDMGARMGGNLIGPCIIPYGTGFDYMAAMICNAMGDDIVWHCDEGTPVVTRLLAFGQGVVKQLPDFHKLEKEYGVEIYHHLELGQQVNEYHTNLDGCGYIVAKADTTEEAIKKADTVLDIIKNSIF